MIQYKCKNCKWEGSVLSTKPLPGKCPNCGEDVVKTQEDPKSDLDINNDGKVDEKDASLAGKVMANQRHKKKGKKK